MCIEKVFDKHTAAGIKEELDNYGAFCFYDSKRKKIIYDSSEHALLAYNEIQVHEMKKHRWIESEKRHEDVGKESDLEWIASYSSLFRIYWKRTHVYIPPEMEEEENNNVRGTRKKSR